MRLRHRIGRRGASLLFLGFLDLVVGYTIHIQPRAVYGHVDARVAYIWMLVGAACVISAFFSKDFPAFTAAMTLKFGWGVFTGIFWLSNHTPYGYLAPAIWFSFAAFVGVLAGWEEPPHPPTMGP